MKTAGDRMKKLFSHKTKIYFIYTILFILMAIIVFSIFAKYQCTFIWQADGLKQHYIILKDFNEKICSFLKSPSQGLDFFSWNMGLGLDVIGQYSYYVLGDPFAYLSLLFPMKYLEHTYTFLILLRMFCVGVSFIWYGRYHGKTHSNFNLLLGAIIYTFSSFALFAGVRHPYFLNAMISFPLLLWGVDKLLEENKKIPLAILIAISAISNYYFFYMHTIMIVIYAIIHYACEYRKEGMKHFFKKIGSAVLSYMVGVLIAGIILLPTIYAFLNSARSGEEVICQYGLDYYKSLFSINLLTVYGENWSYIGVSSIILLMLPILWSRRKTHKVYAIYLLIATIILLVPFLGSMMNGFSFPNNRWSFMYAFILAYIVTLCFDKQYTKKEIRNMCLFLGVYSLAAIIAVLCMKSMSCFVIYLIQILMAFFMLMVIGYQNFENVSPFENKKALPIILLLVILNIGIMAYGLYSSYDKNYAKQFVEAETCEEKLATQLGSNQNYAQNIQNIMENDKSFYRISKVPHQVQNLSIYYGYASTECFLSLGNKYVYDLNRKLADNNYSTTSSIRGMGDRTKITTLLANQYYVVDVKNEKNIPYGYSLQEENGEVKTYRNDFPLSIGVSYSEYLLREEYEKLNPIEKEDALFKVAVIEKEEDLKGLNLKKKEDMQDVKTSYNQVPYQVTDKDNILKENAIITTKKDQKIILQIPSVQNSELYVFISGFEFQGNSKHTITANFQGKAVSKSVENKLTSAYYQKAPEILLNLGYYEKTEGDIELKFSTKGIYQFDKIQVLAVPMNLYQEEVQNLQKNELKEVSVKNQEVKGILHLENDSILQIATSYTKGWKAYIDETPTDTIRVNTAFVGIPVKAGEHEITLEYEVPYLEAGIFSSIAGVILLSLLVIIEKRKRRTLLSKEDIEK